MKIKNFELVKVNNQQVIEIDYLGKIYDLHNAAKFLKVDYEIKAFILTCSGDYYINENSVIPFKIRFNGVEYFDISPRDIEMPKDEDDCLEQIIYGEKIELRFMGGMKIVVKAEEVSFERMD